MNANLELRHLRYFLAVGEELHFGRAAKRLHIAQPPLSQQIRRLEEIVGYQLFIRSSRSVQLTAAGQALLDRARRSLTNLQNDLQIVQSIAHGESGTLTVGFVGSAMLTSLPDLLGYYRAQYPHVELRLREIHTSQLLQEISSGVVDVGFLRDVGPSDSLQIRTYWKESFRAFVPACHPLARRRGIRMAQLRDEPFVFFPKSAGSYAWDNTIDLCREAGFLPTIVQEAPQWLTVLRLVGAGLGVTIAPASVEPIATANVASCRIIATSRQTTIDLTCRRDDTSPLVQAFMELVNSFQA